jgi:cytochrome c oxidase cbb3-type subunit 3
MSSRYRTEALALLGVLALAGCQRETRDYTSGPADDTPPAHTAMSNLVAGQSDLELRARQERTYTQNAYHVTQGEQLYSAFNCVGCHAHGGGDVGPALMDDKWIYGGEIDQIYLSIAQGRPNGMPAFAGKIPPQQIWEIAAYVRSLGGHVPKAAQSARSDHMQMAPPPDKPASTVATAGDEGVK